MNDETLGNRESFPGGSDDKEFACHAEDPGSISGLGRSCGIGNGYPLQYFCLENFMEREAWWATAITKGRIQLGN